MYSKDAGEAIVQTLEKYEDVETPLCIGTGTDITIKELVELITKIVDYQGKVNWDTSKPDGQMRKLLHSDKMREILDVPLTEMQFALSETINWYLDHKQEADDKI